MPVEYSAFAGRPSGVSGDPGAWYKFREFESPRVHTRINSWGLFPCAQIDLRKAREREFAHSMKNRRAVGLLNPMRDKNER